MDWTQIIITTLSLLIGGGGIVTLATLRDKKTEALLENIEKVLQNNSETNKEWQDIAAERAGRCAELKTDIDRKDEKIDELRRDKEALMQTLDGLRTEKAIAEVMRCTKTGCPERHPPFGSGLNPSACIGCVNEK